MFFVISLTLLINGNNVESKFDSWFGMGNSWFGGLICSTGVGCSNEVGPMQHGCVVWCLFNID